jgi:hypothetical protein
MGHSVSRSYVIHKPTHFTSPRAVALYVIEQVIPYPFLQITTPAEVERTLTEGAFEVGLDIDAELDSASSHILRRERYPSFERVVFSGGETEMVVGGCYHRDRGVLDERYGY